MKKLWSTCGHYIIMVFILIGILNQIPFMINIIKVYACILWLCMLIMVCITAAVIYANMEARKLIHGGSPPPSEFKKKLAEVDIDNIGTHGKELIIKIMFIVVLMGYGYVYLWLPTVILELCMHIFRGQIIDMIKIAKEYETRPEV